MLAKVRRKKFELVLAPLPTLRGRRPAFGRGLLCRAREKQQVRPPSRWPLPRHARASVEERFRTRASVDEHSRSSLCRGTARPTSKVSHITDHRREWCDVHLQKSLRSAVAAWSRPARTEFPMALRPSTSFCHSIMRSVHSLRLHLLEEGSS